MNRVACPNVGVQTGSPPGSGCPRPAPMPRCAFRAAAAFRTLRARFRADFIPLIVCEIKGGGPGEGVGISAQPSAAHGAPAPLPSDAVTLGDSGSRGVSGWCPTVGRAGRTPLGTDLPRGIRHSAHEEPQNRSAHGGPQFCHHSWVLYLSQAWRAQALGMRRPLFLGVPGGVPAAGGCMHLTAVGRYPRFPGGHALQGHGEGPMLRWGIHSGVAWGGSHAAWGCTHSAAGGVFTLPGRARTTLPGGPHIARGCTHHPAPGDPTLPGWSPRCLGVHTPPCSWGPQTVQGCTRGAAGGGS